MSTHPTLISEEPAAEIVGSEELRAVCDSVRLGGREQERRKRDSIMPSRSQRWGWRVWLRRFKMLFLPTIGVPSPVLTGG